MQKFDLNIEKMLENWEVHHAVREIIANALDEQILTGTDEIKIYEKDKIWHIRDFGRGLKYVHFTQNESDEKIKNVHLIGKFGVGLKDALATFDRHGVGVKIQSKYGTFTTLRSEKHGFSDLKTLHVCIDKPDDENFKGTDFALEDCADGEIEKAKNMFLAYSGMELLGECEIGEVYEKRGEVSEIFINGIKVAEEENFLFSYNITALNAILRKSLNRERTNIGRAAYSSRIKDILLKIEDMSVVEPFVSNLEKMSEGEQCDELGWMDVQYHFMKLLNKMENVVFVSPNQVNEMGGGTKDILDGSTRRVVYVSDKLLEKITDNEDFDMPTMKTVREEYRESFEYQFVPIGKLNSTEKNNFGLAAKVLKMLKSDLPKAKILISETMRVDEDNTLGVYEPLEDRVVILRRVLSNKVEFLGVLAHELTHRSSGADDCTRKFENALTDIIGELLNNII